MLGLSVLSIDCRAADVKIGYFSNYAPAEIEANILAAIVAGRPALGVGRATLVGTDVTPAWIGLQRGDTDLLVEVDLPNQQLLLDKAAAVVGTVAQIYGDAGEGFFVPSYVVEGPHAAAPGLKRVDQLGIYKAQFDGKFYDESPGWQTTKYNAKRLKAYAIDFSHLELSDAALIAAVTRAAERDQPIVFFFSHPHWLFRRFALRKLEEPNPYHDGCFDTGDARCAIPSFSAWIGARKDLAARAPRFRAFLSHVRIPIDDIEEMMLKISVEKQSIRDAANRWVDAHRADIDRWVAASASP